MAALAASAMSLRDVETGLDVTTFSVDPTSYSPFENAKRGSAHKVLSGSVIHQDFGLREADFIISFHTILTEYQVMQELWSKYRSRGRVWELRDWFPNKFNVIFALGQASFHPIPVIGSCFSFEVDLTFHVIKVVSWFGSSYG